MALGPVSWAMDTRHRHTRKSCGQLMVHSAQAGDASVTGSVSSEDWSRARQMRDVPCTAGSSTAAAGKSSSARRGRAREAQCCREAGGRGDA